jgi:uncharacterized protein
MGAAEKDQACRTRREFVRCAAAGAAALAVASALGSGTGETALFPAATDARKIDVFAQILPRKYLAAYAKKNSSVSQLGARNRAIADIDWRLKLMDKSADVLQVLTIASPPQEIYVTPAEAAELAVLANDELAELTAKYPDRFAAAVACISTNNMDAALQEADRAINQLGFKGVQICTRLAGGSLDQAQLKPLWNKMSEHDLPIWIHPSIYQDLDQEGGILSWALETSVAAYRLVKAGIFHDYPNIKFITHHCSAILPYLEKHLKPMAGERAKGANPLVEHCRRFYNDTACQGNQDVLMHRYDFFGADRMLFGTGTPLSPMNSQTRACVAQMKIPETEKVKILTRNAASMLRLQV